MFPEGSLQFEIKNAFIDHDHQNRGLRIRISAQEIEKLRFIVCAGDREQMYTHLDLLQNHSLHPFSLLCSCCVGDKQVLFADNIMKVNRKCKLVRRVLIVTDVAVYVLDLTFYRLKHRFPLQNIEKVSLSELSDNFFALRIPSEYDCLMASTRQSEIVTVLVEAVKQLISSNLPENELQVVFSHSFEYYIDAEHVREVHFESVEGGGIKTRFVDK